MSNYYWDITKWFVYYNAKSNHLILQSYKSNPKVDERYNVYYIGRL